MANTVVINGKVYTERQISNIVVGGDIINGDFVPEEYSKKGEVVTLDINIKSLQQEYGEFKISKTVENRSLDAENTNIEIKNAETKLEKDTWINKLIKYIINFLNKFIS